MRINTLNQLLSTHNLWGNIVICLAFVKELRSSLFVITNQESEIQKRNV